jgi:molybdopterin-binding protein
MTRSNWKVAGGHAIVAIVTHESVDNLGLQAGSEAFALVKSSSIILVSGDDGARYSARNRLAGTIARVEPGAVNTEVVIDLAGGGSVAAIVTRESSETMGLAVGGRLRPSSRPRASSSACRPDTRCRYHGGRVVCPRRAGSATVRMFEGDSMECEIKLALDAASVSQVKKIPLLRPPGGAKLWRANTSTAISTPPTSPCGSTALPCACAARARATCRR